MNGALPKFLTAIKAIVYNQERANVFLPMLDTRQGSVTAVANVLSALDGKRKLPRELVPMLAVHTYLMMVDVAMAATGQKPEKGVMKQTIDALLATIERVFKGGSNGTVGQPAR